MCPEETPIGSVNHCYIGERVAFIPGSLIHSDKEVWNLITVVKQWSRNAAAKTRDRAKMNGVHQTKHADTHTRTRMHTGTHWHAIMTEYALGHRMPFHSVKFTRCTVPN